MKRFGSTLIFFAFIVSIFAHSTDLEEWNDYKLKYGKRYEDETEEKTRMEIFLNNKHKIEKHNEKHANDMATFKMSLNKFSDLTHDEFNVQTKGLRSPRLLSAMHVEYGKTDYMVKHQNHRDNRHRNSIGGQHLPDSIDWRDQGAVNEDKIQGDCGSSWAFSVTGAIEGQYFRKNGTLLRLSEQNLLDCASDFQGKCGCGGCSVAAGYRLVASNGISTADKYPTPYTAKDGSCKFNDTNPFKISCAGYIERGDENQLLESIATMGPISVSIDSSHESFIHYSSGIYHEASCSSHNVDLDVLAVGYGTNGNNEDYYIVKNWLGEDWGENGYFKLARNRCNHCGVATNAIYPILMSESD